MAFLSYRLERYSNIARETRTCVCGKAQTIWHIFMECPVTPSLRHREYYILNEMFADAADINIYYLFRKR